LTRDGEGGLETSSDKEECTDTERHQTEAEKAEKKKEEKLRKAREFYQL